MLRHKIGYMIKKNLINFPFKENKENVFIVEKFFPLTITMRR